MRTRSRGPDALESIKSLILVRNGWTPDDLPLAHPWAEAREMEPPEPRLECPHCRLPVRAFSRRPREALEAGERMLAKAAPSHAILARANAYWQPLWEQDHGACIPELVRRGWVKQDPRAALEALAQQAAPEKKEDVWFRDVVRCGLTRDDFDRRRFTHFSDERTSESGKRAKAKLMLHAPRDGKGIALVGPTGTGKTHLLMALCMKLLRDGYQTTWLRFADVVTRLRKAAARQEGETGETVDALVVTLAQAEHLFLDDLGAEHGSSFVTASLLDALDTRARFRKPLYLTTNKSLEEIAKAYDERVASRIAALTEVVEVAGRDQRRGG